jgi:hypothetical protein
MIKIALLGLVMLVGSAIAEAAAQGRGLDDSEFVVSKPENAHAFADRFGGDPENDQATPARLLGTNARRRPSAQVGRPGPIDGQWCSTNPFFTSYSVLWQHAAASIPGDSPANDLG